MITLTLQEIEFITAKLGEAAAKHVYETLKLLDHKVYEAKQAEEIKKAEEAKKLEEEKNKQE